MEPVAVDQRCEFLSAAWIDAAAAYLEQAVRNRADLKDVRFSLCEVFTDPPAALCRNGDAVAWHFRVSGCRAIAAAGVLDDADVTVRARYQVALGYAQVIHGAGTESTARQHRELAHRFGADALSVSGELPRHEALATLLADLHDHMAARTVENPDLPHRLAELNLERQAEQLRADGYAVIERAITPEFADELCALTATEVTRHHPLTTNGLLMRDRRFEELALHVPTCALAQSAVGQNMILGAMSGTFKKTGPGAIPLHADYPLVRDPYPEFGLIAVAVWALQDWDSTDVGPTWVVPGSHRRRRAPRPEDDTGAAVPVLVPRGSVLLISHGIWHWQGDRTAADARVAVHVTYNRVFVRQLDDFSSLDEASISRNPPAFSTLLGRDDPFGKSSYQGHDGKRFAYAGRHTQT
jgi:hypothetical protein